MLELLVMHWTARCVTGRSYPTSNVFRLKQRFGQIGCAVSTALLNTPANADAIISTVERLSWRLWRNIVWESRLSQPRVLERLCDDQLQSYRSKAHLFLAIIPYIWHVANPFYAVFCGQTQRVLDKSVRSTSTAFILEHDMITIVLSVNIAVKSTSVLTFWLHITNREYCRGVRNCLQRGWVVHTWCV